MTHPRSFAGITRGLLPWSLLAALAAMSPTRATASEAGPPPLSAEARRVFEHLQGNLTANLNCVMGGKRHQMTGKVSCEKAAGGRGLFCRVRAQIAGLPPYEDVTLFGWDSHGSGYHMYTVNSLGETHDHRGSFKGNVLTLEHAATEGGKPFVETLTFDLSTPGQVGFRNLRRSGDEVTMDVTGTYRK